MTTIYSYEKAKKSFDLIFKKATTDGKVAIRKDNELYILMPASRLAMTVKWHSVHLHA